MASRCKEWLKFWPPKHRVYTKETPLTNEQKASTWANYFKTYFVFTALLFFPSPPVHLTANPRLLFHCPDDGLHQPYRQLFFCLFVLWDTIKGICSGSWNVAQLLEYSSIMQEALSSILRLQKPGLVCMLGELEEAVSEVLATQQVWG